MTSGAKGGETRTARARGRYIVEADLGGLARRSSGRISHMIATSLWLVARSSRQQQARFKHSRLGRDSAVPARWQVPTDPESQNKSGGAMALRDCAPYRRNGRKTYMETYGASSCTPDGQRTSSTEEGTIEGRHQGEWAPTGLRTCRADRGGEGVWLGTPARGRCGAMIVISARACRLGRIQRVGIAARPAGRHGAARARGF